MVMIIVVFIRNIQKLWFYWLIMNIRTFFSMIIVDLHSIITIMHWYFMCSLVCNSERLMVVVIDLP